MLNNEILQLPKIDLHCHLDGSLPLKSICELLQRDVKAHQLQAGEHCGNLAEYLEKFDLPLSCMQTEEGIKKASKDFLLETAKEQIRYIEVRFAPLLSVNETLNCRDVIEAVLTGLKEARAACGVHYNVIVCAMRHHTQKQNLEMLKISREFLGCGVCAADLAGNEAAFPMKHYTELFEQAKRWGMPFTIHAGECGSVENVITAVECGAARIGHGIALKGNREAIGLCREQGIGIEMCPISNLQTKAIDDKKNYPIREFMDAGLCVTINTDNRTVSDTTITKELEFIQKNYGIQDDEIRLLMRNAVSAAFAEDSVKEELWKDLQR